MPAAKEGEAVQQQLLSLKSPQQQPSPLPSPPQSQPQQHGATEEVSGAVASAAGAPDAQSPPASLSVPRRGTSGDSEASADTTGEEPSMMPPMTGSSLATESSLPDGVTPRTLSEHTELMEAVAAVRAKLREAGLEKGEGAGEVGDEGESERLPTGFIVQCLCSRSGVVAEAALVAANFLRFRLHEARWPLRLRARDVAGGPLESGTHWNLPGRDAEGRGVFVFNIGKIDPSQGSLEQFQKMGAYLVERFTREEDIQRLGVVMVANLQGLSFALSRKLMSPRDSRRGIRMWQEAFPCKLKKIYVVGASAFMTHVLQFVVALLGKKLRSRVRVLSHVDDLVSKEGLPASVLPPELGGTLEGFDWAGWCKGVLAAEEAGGEVDPVWAWV